MYSKRDTLDTMDAPKSVGILLVLLLGTTRDLSYWIVSSSEDEKDTFPFPSMKEARCELECTFPFVNAKKIVTSIAAKEHASM